MSRYWKSIIAFLGGLALVLVEPVLYAIDEGRGDGVWDADDWSRVLVAVATTALVYWKANTPPSGEARSPEVSETAR